MIIAPSVACYPYYKNHLQPKNKIFYYRKVTGYK